MTGLEVVVDKILLASLTSVNLARLDVNSAGLSEYLYNGLPFRVQLTFGGTVGVSIQDLNH